MKSDLSPPSVAARLAELRTMARVENAEETRRRLAHEARQEVPFAIAVARRLAELRALLELTEYLHRAHLPPER
ncbi:MAG: hypothetical protein JST00_22390 [Deltaproteobacteria bacterium]|nr:hypothetical protein [Deltaproteobacteria bacterium]